MLNSGWVYKFQNSIFIVNLILFEIVGLNSKGTFHSTFLFKIVKMLDAQTFPRNKSFSKDVVF